MVILLEAQDTIAIGGRHEQLQQLRMHTTLASQVPSLLVATLVGQVSPSAALVLY